MASRKKTLIKHLPEIANLVNDHLQSSFIRMQNNPANIVYLKNYIMDHFNAAVADGKISPEMRDYFKDHVDILGSGNIITFGFK